jgi:hypothetical protein
MLGNTLGSSTKLLVGLVGGLLLSNVACSSAPRKVPATGSAGTTGSGAAGTTATTGTGGDTSTGAGGTATGAGGDTTATGTGGMDAGADAPSTGAAGDTTGAAGTGAAGDAAGATGAAGTTGVDTTPILPLPVAVTANWYPSGWDGDPYTVSQFTAATPPITITDMSTATTGPCSHRVAGALGSCYKITYTPAIAPDGGVPGNASVASLANLPGTSTPNFTDNTMTPRVAPGAMRAAVQVAGAVGGEAVTFNLGSQMDSAYFDMQFTGTALTTNWQQLTTAIQPGYSHIFSPFGWGSSSATPIVFYYDDVRIDATAP